MTANPIPDGSSYARDEDGRIASGTTIAATSLAQQLVDAYLQTPRAGADKAAWITRTSIVEPAKSFLASTDTLDQAATILNRKNWSIRQVNGYFIVQPWVNIPQSELGFDRPQYRLKGGRGASV